MITCLTDADVAELADALDLGSSTARCEGSSPFIRISTRSRASAWECFTRDSATLLNSWRQRLQNWFPRRAWERLKTGSVRITLPKQGMGCGVLVKKKNIHTLKGIKPLRSCMEKEKRCVSFWRSVPVHGVQA